MKVSELSNISVIIPLVETSYNKNDDYYNGVQFDIDILYSLISKEQFFGFLLNIEDYRLELNRIFNCNFNLETDINKDLILEYNMNYKLDYNGDSGCFEFITIHLEKNGITNKTRFSYDIGEDIDYNLRAIKNYNLNFRIDNVHIC